MTDTSAQLLILREFLRSLVLDKARVSILKYKWHFYEYSNHCNKILARKFRKQRSSTYIPHIITNKGNIGTKSQEIANCFNDYYTILYNLKKAETTQTNEQRRTLIKNYLLASGLPRLKDDTIRELEASIAQQELEKSINSSKKGKAPGPMDYVIIKLLHPYSSLILLKPLIQSPHNKLYFHNP